VGRDIVEPVANLVIIQRTGLIMSPDRTQSHLEDLVQELCKLPKENGWVEFKTNWNDPKSIGEYISALSNSAALCGKANAYLVWGVEDETHNIVGTEFRPSQEKRGNEELENWLLRLLDPKLHFHLLEFEYSGNQLSLIEIPRAHERPVRFMGQAFIRVGSYKKLLKDHPEKERELWRIFDRTPFEEQIVREHLPAERVLQLLDVESYFHLLGLPAPESDEVIITRLADDHLVSSSENGHWNILALGAILFARDLGNFSSLERKAVRVVEYKHRDRITAVQEFQGKKGYATGFEGLIKFTNSLIPKNEMIGQAFRRSVPMYPELAVRELVANALIHQDFSATGAGPLIELFENRMEVTNPGTPLVETDRFVDTPPHSRNESLASLMRRIGVCEERGSGIDKVVAETEFFQLPPPLFEVASGQTRCVLFAHQDFENMDKTDRIRACYLHTCLQYVKRESMTNSSLRARFGLDPKKSAKASRVIKDAVEGGLVKRPNSDTGSRRHAKYIPYWA